MVFAVVGNPVALRAYYGDEFGWHEDYESNCANNYDRGDYGEADIQASDEKFLTDDSMNFGIEPMSTTFGFERPTIAGVYGVVVIKDGSVWYYSYAWPHGDTPMQVGNFTDAIEVRAGGGNLGAEWFYVLRANGALYIVGWGFGLPPRRIASSVYRFAPSFGGGYVAIITNTLDRALMIYTSSGTTSGNALMTNVADVGWGDDYWIILRTNREVWALDSTPRFIARNIVQIQEYDLGIYMLDTNRVVRRYHLDGAFVSPVATNAIAMHGGSMGLLIQKANRSLYRYYRVNNHVFAPCDACNNNGCDVCRLLSVTYLRTRGHRLNVGTDIVQFVAAGGLYALTEGAQLFGILQRSNGAIYAFREVDWWSDTGEVNLTRITTTPLAVPAPQRVTLDFYRHGADLPRARIPITINWQPLWFSRRPAHEENRDLAVAGLVLSAAAYDRHLVRAELEKLDFEFVGYYNYGLNIADRVAFTIGINRITNTVAVIIRGTSPGTGDAGSQFNRFVFYQTDASARNVRDTLINEGFLRPNGSMVPGMTYFITGHSRGGATAGMLAHLLAQASGRVVAEERVFVYTFGSPNYTNFLDSVRYRNVFNYVNRHDVIPNTPRMVFSPFPIQRTADRHGISISTGTCNVMQRYFLTLAGRVYDSRSNLSPVGWNPIWDSSFGHPHTLSAHLAYFLVGVRNPIRTNTGRILVFKCPVDIEVFDYHNELVSRIINNVADESLNELLHVYAWVDGDSKSFALPYHGEFDFRITATGSGLMNVSIIDEDRITWEVLEQRDFINIPLHVGMWVIVRNGTGITLDNVRLYLVESGAIIGDISTDGTITRRPQDGNNGGNNNYVSGGTGAGFPSTTGPTHARTQSETETENQPQYPEQEPSTIVTDNQDGTADFPFIDISIGAWYYPYILSVWNNSLFQGTAHNLFSPQYSMTRAMFAQVLANLEDVNTDGDGNNRDVKKGNYTGNNANDRINNNSNDNNAINTTPLSSSFKDVSANAWYFSAVEWAYHMGIVQGIGNNNFAPNTPITREQMAVMLYRYAYVMGIEFLQRSNLTADTNVVTDTNEITDMNMATGVNGITASFTDQTDISYWAINAVNTIQSAGIVAGRPDGSFDPQATVTRAEVATIFARFVDLLQ